MTSGKTKRRSMLSCVNIVVLFFWWVRCCPCTPALAWTGGSSSNRNNHVWSRSSYSNGNPSVVSQRRDMSMYFDDVSRRSVVRWDPPFASSPNKITKKNDEDGNEDVVSSRVQRLLAGYDADSASELSSVEIQEQTRLWTEKAGVVGERFGDELYAHLLSVSVAREHNGNPVISSLPYVGTNQSMVHCLAAFWQSVVAVIDLHSDNEVWPPRWTAQPRYANQNLTAATAFSSFQTNATDMNLHSSLNDRVHMIVFPDCPDLYEYQTFTTLLAAVEFSKELCLHLGRHFTLTAFHPKFKNSPKLFSPERHSPFPTIGLEFKPLWEMGKDADLPLGGSVAAARRAPREQSKKDDSGKILPHPDAKCEDEEIGALADARIRNLDQTRAHFEVLFNSAAAVDHRGQATSQTSTAETSSTLSISSTAAKLFDKSHKEKTTDAGHDGDVDLSEEEKLAMTFRQERQRRRGNFPPEMARQMIALWMDQHRYTDNSNRHLNPALEFMDTIDGYTLCTQKTGEFVYADVWQAIKSLYEKGLSADANLASAADNKFTQKSSENRNFYSNTQNRFNLSKWMTSLSGERKDPHPDEIPEDLAPQVISTLFIVTKFNTYNAQAFKRFAITINAVLKRITDGKMFLEVFHPEYVGNKGYDHDLRRSPFPMIQICYEVRKKFSDNA